MIVAGNTAPHIAFIRVTTLVLGGILFAPAFHHVFANKRNIVLHDV